MDLIAKLRAGVSTGSAAETRDIAARLAHLLPKDCTVALHGDMGVGKTTFVQGLAAGFGLTDQVTSPTFAIYSVHRGASRTLIHLDAYRLEKAEQVDALLLEEFLVSPYCLAVEWPERLGDWIAPTALHLELSIEPQHRHGIRMR